MFSVFLRIGILFFQIIASNIVVSLKLTHCLYLIDGLKSFVIFFIFRMMVNSTSLIWRPKVGFVLRLYLTACEKKRYICSVSRDPKTKRTKRKTKKTNERKKKKKKRTKQTTFKKNTPETPHSVKFILLFYVNDLGCLRSTS